MKEVFYLLFHLLTTLAQLIRPGGSRAVIAENLRHLAQHRAEIRGIIPRADPDVVPVWEGAEKRIEQLTALNLQRLQTLASLG